MSEFPCHRPTTWSAYLGRFITGDHSETCRQAAAKGKVPMWTAEDEENLARRVKRLAAHAS